MILRSLTVVVMLAMGVGAVAATVARTARYCACRSRGMTWVESGSGVRPSLSHTYCSTNGSMFE